jgi:hypothetical protein
VEVTPKTTRANTLGVLWMVYTWMLEYRDGLGMGMACVLFLRRVVFSEEELCLDESGAACDKCIGETGFAGG